MNNAVKCSLLISITLLFATLGSPAEPKDEITGAFGLTLGEPYTDSSVGTTREVTPLCGIREQFEPRNPYGFFNAYYVHTTPESDLVAGIVAYGPAKNVDECEQEKDILLQILKSKYPSLELGEDVLRDRKLDRRIAAQCINLESVPSLRLIYVDLSLCDQANRETRSELTKGRDTSGL